MPFDGTKLNETAAHLLRAKQYIEEHGWLQIDYGIDGGPRCFIGALESCGDYYAVERATRLACNALGEAVWFWQDAPGRTIEEVYAAFDRAIALALEPDK